jgi:hypothetical protein
VDDSDATRDSGVVDYAVEEFTDYTSMTDLDFELLRRGLVLSVGLPVFS